MARLRMWSYRNSVNPDFRLGEPWAVAGLQPEDYGHPEDERMARFWRWTLQQDVSDSRVEGFIVDMVERLYGGANLKQLEEAIGNESAREAYYLLRREFGFNEEQDRYFGGVDAEADNVGEAII